MTDDTRTETDAAAELARQALAPKEVHPAGLYLLPDGDGGARIVDTDAFGTAPRHTAGARVVTDAASFVAYVNRHRRLGTEVFAHTNTSSVVAVIDSHESSDTAEVYMPGWQKHTVRLALEKSKAWLAWEAADGHLFTQEEFADFLDDRYLDVIEPVPARMIEIARTFQAHTKVAFESSIREASGDVKLNYTEDTAAKAGQKGDIEIPARIQIALRPYIGGPIYSIWASFRYRLRGGSVHLGFKLERPEVILDLAFTDIVTEIREGRTDKKDGVETRVHDGIGDVPIFNGKPSS
jgi:uncharacterized protein YfdQ (DUF2303 family)